MTSVSFDRRSVIIDGQRKILLSGAVHYPRSTPDMWRSVLRQSRLAGLNCIDTYVFWEAHERRKGVYDFTDRLDLGRFLDICQEEGLYVILRIGPYICAEWNFGGLPAWLISEKGLITRTWNKPFMDQVKCWMKVLMAKIGNRQITQGGPIILAQMENEYKNIAGRYGQEGQRYLQWISQMAKQTGLEVPMIMCEGASADSIETLNGFSVWERVASLRHHRPDQPILWTENYPGWYDVWGRPHHQRRVEEMVFELMRFFAAGGSGVNYYMWYGGTNFDRDAMYLQTTSYDFDAPIDEYGMMTQKSKQLSLFHAFIQKYESLILSGKRVKPEVVVAGEASQPEKGGVCVYSFKGKQTELVFVTNAGSNDQKIQVRKISFSLPARSAVAIVGETGTHKIVCSSWQKPKKTIVRKEVAANIPLRWQWMPEPAKWDVIIEFSEEQPKEIRLPHNMLGETHHQTDFGWYRTVVDSPKSEKVILQTKVADILYVWVNGHYIGSVPERLKEDRPKPGDFEIEITLPLKKGKNEIVLMVCELGMIKGDWMIDNYQSRERKGISAPVTLKGKPIRTGWQFSAGLVGERLKYFQRPNGLDCWSNLVKHKNDDENPNPLRWYRSTFFLTQGQKDSRLPWALKIGNLYQGRLWINGHGLGRYWQVPSNPAEFAHYNDPIVSFDRVGLSTQELYHIPNVWLKAGINTLVIFEQAGRFPENTQLVNRF